MPNAQESLNRPNRAIGKSEVGLDALVFGEPKPKPNAADHFSKQRNSSKGVVERCSADIFLLEMFLRPRVRSNAHKQNLGLHQHPSSHAHMRWQRIRVVMHFTW